MRSQKPGAATAAESDVVLLPTEAMMRVSRIVPACHDTNTRLNASTETPPPVGTQTQAHAALRAGSADATRH